MTSIKRIDYKNPHKKSDFEIDGAVIIGLNYKTF